MSIPTQQEVFALHRAWGKAEAEFERIYTAQAQRLGVRPGDFRFQRERHSPEVLRAADAFVSAGEAWRRAFRARNQADAEALHA